MSASIYADPLFEPNPGMLTYDLASAKPFFDKIADTIATQYGAFTSEWKFYNKKSGWVLKMFSKKRNVLFMVPCTGYFKVVFTFGNKATDMVLASHLPDTIKCSLLEAPKYAEGRTIQLEVKTETDLQNVLQLITFKLHP